MQDKPASLHNILLRDEAHLLPTVLEGKIASVTLHARLLLAITLAALTAAEPRLYSAVTRHAQPRVAPDAPLLEPVDINRASLGQLLKVSGLTQTWAARIIRFRPYRGKNELLDRGIVTDEVYARIKDRIIAHRIRN